MTAATNADRLREIMTAHRLTRPRVAALLDVSLDTVHAWLRPPDNRAWRPMRARDLRMLEMIIVEEK